jgi:hypothetical protein
MLWYQKRHLDFIRIGIGIGGVQYKILCVLGYLIFPSGKGQVPLLVPQHRAAGKTRNSQRTMGRKDIGHRKKSGMKGSSNSALKHALIQQDKARAGYYKINSDSIKKRDKNNGTEQSSLDSDADDSADEDDNDDNHHKDSPPVLKLTYVTVGKEI